MTKWISPKSLIILLGFCLYTLLSVYYFNTVGLTMFGPNSQAAFEDATAVSLLVCFLFMLAVTIIRRKADKTNEEETGKGSSFLSETVISGFFFAAGSFFCLNGITVREVKNAIGPYSPALLSWSQVCILSLLMLSVIVFVSFLKFKKETLLSFIGYILILIGLFSLYYDGYSFDNDSFLQLSILFLKGSQTAAPATNLIIAGVFWFISITVNKSISARYQQDLVWTETLLFGFLISALGVFCLSILYNRNVLFYSDFHYESVFIYAGFLFFCIQCYLLLLKYENWLLIKDNALKIWGAVILILNVAFFLCFHKDFQFMIKITLCCLGILLIWNSKSHLKMEEWRSKAFETVVLLLLGYVMTWGIIRVFLQIFLYGIWLQDTMLWKYIVLFQEHKYVCVFLLSVIVTGFLKKRYSFGRAYNVMCRGIILCMMALFAAGLVQEFIFAILGAVVSTGKLGWWASVSKETQGMLLGVSLIASSVLSLIISVWQCKRGIGRIIVWSLLSNMVFYIGLGFCVGLGFMQLFLLKDIAARLGVDDKVITAFFLGIVPYLMAVVLLGLSVILLCFTKIEQSVLPKLMNCRMPDSDEKERLKIISSVVSKKTGIPFSSYRVLICLKSDNNPFTIGRNTIAIPKSLLDYFPIDEITGLIAHELGHIKQKDGHYSFIIDILNIPIHLVSKIVSALLSGQKKTAMYTLPVFFIILFSGLSSTMVFGMSRIIFYFLLKTAIEIIRKQDFRESEFAADSFASGHGLGNELKSALLQLGEQKDSLSLWEMIMSDYPDFPERIKRLDAVT